MFDLTGLHANTAALRELIFIAVGFVVTALLLYGLNRQQRS